MSPTEKKYQVALEIGQRAHDYFNTIRPSLSAMPGEFNFKQLHFLGRQCKYLALLGHEGGRNMPSVNLVMNYAKHVADDYRLFDETVRPFIHNSVTKEQWMKSVEMGVKTNFDVFANWRRIGQSNYFMTRAYAYSLVGRLRARRLDELYWEITRQGTCIIRSMVLSAFLVAMDAISINHPVLLWAFTAIMLGSAFYCARKQREQNITRTRFGKILKKQERTTFNARRLVGAATEANQSGIAATIPSSF